MILRSEGRKYYDQGAAARAKCAFNGYSVLPNHSPIIPRTEPEWIASFSDFTSGQGRAVACRPVVNSPRLPSPETRPRRIQPAGKAVPVAGRADPGRGAERFSERFLSRLGDRLRKRGFLSIVASCRAMAEECVKNPLLTPFWF